MKKFLCLALMLLMLFSLCACGENSTVQVEDPGKSSETETPENTAKPEEEVAEPEESEAPASLCTVTLTDADASGFNLPENKICTVDPEGRQILITLSGDAQQVRLCTPLYYDGFNYAGTGTILWNGGDMKSGSQIGLRLYIPDVAPNVVLCYSDAAGDHVYGISDSGLDGSLHLTDMLAMNEALGAN